MRKYTCLGEIEADSSLSLSQKINEAYLLGLETGLEGKEEFDSIKMDDYGRVMDGNRYINGR